MKLWVMPCRATQDGQVMVESSNKTWSTGEGNGKPHQYSCLENPMNRMKRQKDMTMKETPKLVLVHYATGEERRNCSRRKEWGGGAKAELTAYEWMTLVVSKAQCWKEQCWVVTWNVRSINQCKLQVVKTGDSESKHRHFRNHWTQKDGNGQI